MRHMLMPIGLIILLCYVADSYYTHGVYFRMLRDAVENLF